MRPLEFGWYLPTHGDTTAYGVAAGPGGGVAGIMRARGAGGGAGGLRISPDPGGLDLLGGLDIRRVHGGAFVQRSSR